MKSFTVLMLTLISLSSGCKNYEEQIEQLQTTNQELSSSLEDCNSLLEEYKSTINDIESRLYRTIPESDRAGQSENLQQIKTRVNTAITKIDSLLKENEEREQALRNRAYRAGSRVDQLQEEIDTLYRTIATKDSIINSYNQQVAELNNTVEELNSEIDELNIRITEANERADMITDTLNYAYYTSGTGDELIENNIIQKTGGFLGFLGQVKKLNPQLDLNQLERVDIRERKTFEINAEVDDLLMVSPHPKDSYSLESADELSSIITINDVDEFWRVSRYLILVTDE
ncbi:MAG: hypothetical protein ACOCZL_00915 [Bacteroidota bacterium]